MDATELQALEPDCKWISVEVYPRLRFIFCSPKLSKRGIQSQTIHAERPYYELKCEGEAGWLSGGDGEAVVGHHAEPACHRLAQYVVAVQLRDQFVFQVDCNMFTHMFHLVRCVPFGPNSDKPHCVRNTY
jgi:hypothetical protein